jgi:two-component system NtrC family sensor kinase
MFVAKPKPVRTSCFTPEKTLEKAADFLFSMGQTKYLSILREFTCCGELVEGDENQLEQVFMNLIANATHAMEDMREKIITLRTSVDYTQGQVHISVTDTGCGIDTSIQEKIFDPFFTTKETGKGNGLGLSIVKQIVERQGGTLSFVSEPGSGSSFTVSLPLKQMHAAVVEEESV